MKKTCRLISASFAALALAAAPAHAAAERRGAVPPEGAAGARLFPRDVTNVCVVSVSSIIDPKAFVAGTNLLAQCGYTVRVMPNVLGPRVAPAAERARLFEAAWLAPENDILLFARGGKGAREVLPLVDWEKLRGRDMRVVGFSDVSQVVNAMLAKGAGHPYSGPMLSSMSRWNRASRKWFGAMMDGAEVEPLKVRVLKSGAAKGLPMGGHIERMHELSKTPFMPAARGRVVFFECTARYPPATVQKCLEELRDGGFLDGAAAVVFADFRHGGEDRRLIDAFLPAFAQTLPCPVFADFPYGHIPGSRLLDFRREVRISPEGLVAWE